MTQEHILLQPNEEITPIQGYEGLYSITSFGRVWSHKRINWRGRKCGGIFLKCRVDRRGYAYSNTYIDKHKKSQYFHRLVAQHYIPNPQNLPEVNHKDGNKLNNFAGTREKNFEDGNLEWCTNEENMNHAMVNRMYSHKVTSNYFGVTFKKYRKKSWVSRVVTNKILKYIGCFYTEIEAAKAYNDYILEHNLNRPLNYIEDVVN